MAREAAAKEGISVHEWLNRTVRNRAKAALHSTDDGGEEGA